MVAVNGIKDLPQSDELVGEVPTSSSQPLPSSLPILRSHRRHRPSHPCHSLPSSPAIPFTLAPLQPRSSSSAILLLLPSHRRHPPQPFPSFSAILPSHPLHVPPPPPRAPPTLPPTLSSSPTYRCSAPVHWRPPRRPAAPCPTPLPHVSLCVPMHDWLPLLTATRPFSYLGWGLG